ncbi:MAG: NfeD family protein [Thermodesulfovibrionales bacterium]
MLKSARFLIILALLLFFPFAAWEAESDRTVLVLTLSSVINPVAAEYVEKGLEKAKALNASLVVIELDTPGGLDTSMRSIIKAMTLSEIPVTVFISPSGARAASAGVFITMAAHVAAMSPGTNIGAAHPVGLGGKMDETMQEKVTNDAVAYLKSLAQKHGRNARWAEDAVRKSVSATETEAVRERVVDLLADDLDDLFAKINGRKVVTVSGEVSLETLNPRVVKYGLNFRMRLLSLITDPNIAYILMLLGFYGIFFELINPGAIFPGVLGGICLILAFYSFQTLPVNYAGILLILLGLIMFLLEIKIVSYGILTIGGVISIIIGSIMLFDTPGPFIKLSLSVILPAAAVTALFFSVTIRLAYRAWKSKPVTGSEGLVGLEGVALSDVFPEGMVLVHGEYWRARSDLPIRKGEGLIVEAVQGLTLKVKKKDTNKGGTLS